MEVTQRGDKREEFGGGPVFREQDSGVAGRVDTKIAMESFGGMQEDGSGAGGAQRGDEFARDVAGLADARDDDFAGVRENQFDRANQGVIEPKSGLGDGGGFDTHGLAGSVEPGGVRAG